jgi:hypothetical protein
MQQGKKLRKKNEGSRNALTCLAAWLATGGKAQRF